MYQKFHRFPDPAAPAVELDFDKLSNADTGDDSTTVNLQNLPDMTAMLKAQLEQQQQQQAPPAPPIPPEQQQPNIDWIKPYESINNKLKEKYQDFEIPSEVKPEEYSDFVLNYIESKTANSKRLDPVIEQIQGLVESGVPVNEAINKFTEQTSFLNMTPDQRMYVHMKNEFGATEQNPNGLNDEEIKDRVERMRNSGYLEIEDRRIQKEYKDRQTIRQQQQYQESIQKWEADFDIEEQKRSKVVGDMLSGFEKLDNIAGIPLTQSDKAEFTDTFRQITKRDKTTGLSIADALLQSNDLFTKAMFLILKAEPKIKQLVTETKEGVKKNILDKLDANPGLMRGNSTVSDPFKVDLDALSAPEN
jgi:hypothetical protein